MKFVLFADFHYAPHKFLSGEFAELKEIQETAERENCDFIIHAGDFCNAPAKYKDFVDAYNDFHIPSYHCIGNHESGSNTFAQTLAVYKMDSPYYYFDCKGYRMIVLDPNYYRDGENFIHYEFTNYHAPGVSRDWVPQDQLNWLKEAVDSSPYPCILISHESFERPDGVKNRADVLKIINDANKKKPHSVLMCINGHHHRDHIRILDGICYFDVNSTKIDWIEGITHDRYPAELLAKYRALGHTVVYTDPLYCVVEIEGTTIDIKGRESTMFMGISREDVGGRPFDRAGRPVVPKIQSVKLTLG